MATATKRDRSGTKIPTAGLILFVLSAVSHIKAEPVDVNPETATYDSHPAVLPVPDSGTWYAWHGYRDNHDSILARLVDSNRQLGPLYEVAAGEVHGPPQLVKGRDRVAVVWSTRVEGRWRIAIRWHEDGVWGKRTYLSRPENDAIYPAAVGQDDGSVNVVWSERAAGRWRICGRQLRNETPSAVVDFSSIQVDAFRPRLVEHQGQVWCFWDQYQDLNYSVWGGIAFPERRPPEQISPPGAYCLTPTALSHGSTLCVAWLQKSDVIGGPGVISQWHTLHASLHGPAGWRPILNSRQDTVAAELTHGIMAQISPRPVATGGYLGRRLHPMLAIANDQLWLLWERKTDHRGRTATVAGDLIARPCENGRWGEPLVLRQDRLDYHVVHESSSRSGEFRVLASRLPRRGLRRYEDRLLPLQGAQPLLHTPWRGWKDVQLPIKGELPPRRSIQIGDKTYRLYWADLHCHNWLTADAEGEPDELQFYARDRARLDVVVFTNNDFYNVPLTQYEYALGNLFADFFSRPRAGDGGFLSLPGFEWTSRIPAEGAGELADSRNWLPPTLEGSYPNHRTVIYPPDGGPLVHFPEVGNDIQRLNVAVQQAGGLTLSQHDAFKLSGHPVEVGLELTSGWRNYIQRRPELFHGPLNQGVRLGFTANGDTHRRAPGLSGALTGIYAENLSAKEILAALRERRCFATMGSRIFLDTRVGDAIMGEHAQVVGDSATLTLRAEGTRPITQATLIRNGKVIFEAKGTGSLKLECEFTDESLAPGTHWYYWRVAQEGVGPVLKGNLMPAHGHLAWSSPTWVVASKK